MANRLITIEECAAEWDRIVKKNDIDPKEFALVLAYNAACAYDEEEERQVRVLMGLEGD